jgi:hypothetical protein
MGPRHALASSASAASLVELASVVERMRRHISRHTTVPYPRGDSNRSALQGRMFGNVDGLAERHLRLDILGEDATAREAADELKPRLTHAVEPTLID